MPCADHQIIGDAGRLQALHQLHLLDTQAEIGFDRLTSLACRVLNTPVSLITLVDKNRQFIKSQVGWPESLASLREIPLSHSFCQHVVATQQPLIVENALIHPLVYDNMGITDLKVMAYVGIPLMNPDGQALGALCIIDSQPRCWTEQEVSILTDLAALVMTEIELYKELTERKKLVEQLAERERFANQIINAVPASIFTYDLESGDIVYLSQGSSSLLGYDTTHRPAMNVRDLVSLIHPDDVDSSTFEELFAHAADHEVIQKDYRARHVDGTWRWLSSRSKVFSRDASGAPSQILAVAHDITSLKKAEQQAIELTLEREQIRLLREFIDHTSHDLRTPLTMINTSLYLAERLTDHVQQRKHLRVIYDQAAHLKQILDDFQVMADLDHTNSLDYELVEVSQMVKKIVRRAEARYRNQADYQVSYTTVETPLWITAHALQLELAITGVVENAFVHSPNGGQITVRVTHDTETLMIEVTDSGVGITPEERLQIFKPFYKIDKARTQNTSRSGLGLAIVKRVIELHHGSIRVISTPGQGSTFGILLPS